jgi:hypothetical protein
VEVDMSEVKVVELPERRRGKVDWDLVRSTADAHPGKWVDCGAILNPAVATQIRRGQYKALPPPDYDVTSQVVESGVPTRCRIYVRRQA